MRRRCDTPSSCASAPNSFDTGTKKGGLALSAPGAKYDDAETMSRWVKVHDRLRHGEMPPKDKPRPDAAAVSAYLGSLNK